MQYTQGKGGALRRGTATIVAVVVLLFIAGLLLKDTIFLIKRQNAHVEGLVLFSEDEVLQIAGIGENTSFFSLRQSDIASRIDANRYLSFLGMETHFPDGVTLRVRERVACANMLHRGMQYILDDEGYVLERAQSIRMDNGLMALTGFALYSDMILGAPVPCQRPAQLETYVALLAELRAQGFLSEIVELNITSTESLFMVTASGYTVHLGDGSDLRAKIGTVRAAIEQRQLEQLPAGILDAAKPGFATYSPVGI